MPPQKSALKWHLQPSMTSRTKDYEGHSFVQTSCADPPDRDKPLKVTITTEHLQPANQGPRTHPQLCHDHWWVQPPPAPVIHCQACLEQRMPTLHLSGTSTGAHAERALSFGTAPKLVMISRPVLNVTWTKGIIHHFLTSHIIFSFSRPGLLSFCNVKFNAKCWRDRERFQITHCIFRIMPFNKNEILKERERKRARQTAGQRDTHTQTERDRVPEKRTWNWQTNTQRSLISTQTVPCPGLKSKRMSFSSRLSFLRRRTKLIFFPWKRINKINKK